MRKCVMGGPASNPWSRKTQHPARRPRVSVFLRFDAQFLELRLEDSFVAFRAKTVAEFGVGVPCEVMFDLLPIILVIADFFAVGADREDAAELFDFRQRLLEFLHSRG